MCMIKGAIFGHLVFKEICLKTFQNNLLNLSCDRCVRNSTLGVYQGHQETDGGARVRNRRGPPVPEAPKDFLGRSVSS